MPLTPSFVTTPGKFTWFNLGAFLGAGETTEERKEQNVKALQFFQFFNLVPTIETLVYCPSCRFQLKTEKDKTKNFLGFCYKCSNIQCPEYDTRLSPLNNTIFSKGKLPLQDKGKNYFGLSDVLKLMSMWLCRVPVTHAQIQAEVGSSKTAVEWYHKFRKICRITESHDTGKIGGADDVVEVDESHIYKRKHHKGRQLYSEKHLWVFGGISRLTGKRFAVRVDKRDKETLHREIRENIEEDTYLLTDGWAPYISSVENCNLKGHSSVNHSIGEFVAEKNVIVADVHRSLGIRVLPLSPSTSTEDTSLREIQVHTNTVERMWRDLKEHIKNIRANNASIEDSIGEWLYRRNILDYESRDYGQKFIRFLNDVKRVHPGVGEVEIKDPHGTESCECSTCKNLEVTNMEGD